MTDNLNKTQQSCTGYRTPETDAQYEATIDEPFYTCYYKMTQLCKKLERERDANRAVIETQKELIDTLKKQREEAEAIARQCERVSNIYEQRMLEAEAANLKLERERDAARELSINLEVSLTAAIRSVNVRQEEVEQAIAERDEAIKMLEEIKSDALEIQFIKYGYDGCCGSTHIAALIERKCEETINRIKNNEASTML